MTETLTIDGRRIGPGQPPYIVAELSGNHQGRLDRALKLMEMAKDAGADAVKIQTYRPDTITIDHNGPGFQIKGGLWDGRSLYELYGEAQTPWDWHPALFDHGRKLGVTVFSSPFDATAVDFLEGLNAPAYKIASFEIVDIPLIEKAARTGKPMIISTGMADRAEIAAALAAARRGGANGVVLLHCTSGYPTPHDEIHLQTMPDLARSFDAPIGLSDHTLGVAVPVAAVALGAVMIEKHLTNARSEGGPDAAFSLEPHEFKAMAEACRIAYSALGEVKREPAPSEAKNRHLRRSLYVVADIPAGAPFTAQNVRSIRPGYGLPPAELGRVLRARAARDLKRGAPLDLTMLSEDKGP